MSDHDPRRENEDLSAALARADASYEPIDDFEEWAPGGLSFDVWDQEAVALASHRSRASSDAVAEAIQSRLRAAAVDTGAIEGLYRTDRGFTMSVAEGTISLDQAEVEKGPEFRRNFEAQLEAFQMALDVATQARPVTEVLVRQLHEVTCAGQPSYRVITQFGVQERQLNLGTYKSDPNHPQRGDGSFHSYAPVGAVVSEMGRLIEQFRSPAFLAAHPVVQAAYAHHAFVRIHPFPDGNGRVARLLGSIWLLRAASIPMWIEVSDRDQYLDSLAAADAGDAQPWIRLVRSTSLSLLRELAQPLVEQRERTRLTRRTTVRDATKPLADLLAKELDDRMPKGRVFREAGGSGVLPGGLEYRPSGLVAFAVVREDRTDIDVGIAIDWAAEPDSRYVVVFAHDDAAHPEFPTVWEHFGEDELVPELSPGARRRVAGIASIISTLAL